MAQAPTRTQGNGQAKSLALIEHLSPTRTRRRATFWRVMFTAGCAIAGGFVFVALYSSAGARHPVLAVSQPVAQGQLISASDLRIVRVAADPGLSPIPYSDEASVVGRRAAVGLVPGTLLTPSDLSSSPLLGIDEASVGLNLKPGQFPDGLAPGDAVALIETQGQNTTAGATTSAASVVVDKATVVSVSEPSADSGSSDEEVTLAIPADLASQVVGAASSGDIALSGLGPQAGS